MRASEQFLGRRGRFGVLSILATPKVKNVKSPTVAFGFDMLCLLRASFLSFVLPFWGPCFGRATFAVVAC